MRGGHRSHRCELGGQFRFRGTDGHSANRFSGSGYTRKVRCQCGRRQFCQGFQGKRYPGAGSGGFAGNDGHRREHARFSGSLVLMFGGTAIRPVGGVQTLGCSDMGPRGPSEVSTQLAVPKRSTFRRRATEPGAGNSRGTAGNLAGDTVSAPLRNSRSQRACSTASVRADSFSMAALALINGGNAVFFFFL